ncbi:hypothetical protein E3N88_16431 [Mikania micrantha]|uniref:Uncharacterized protein n=1 Tax=Mikania micrantha TaxID=192012 RepID=A0A5N6P030_9ASTR|nr:hypothetical protein E3N88_16431 [Mikania micrantha]
MDPTRVAANGTDLLNTVSHPSYMSESAQTRQLKRKCQEEEVCDHGSPFRSKLLVKRVCLKSRTETLKWVRRRKGRHGWRKEKVKKFSARCEAGMEKRGREHQKG